MTAAQRSAAEGQLVTFGVTPSRAETGYGYLELVDKSAAAATEPQPLSGFTEKPDLAAAQAMIHSGRYLWNAGIFLFSVAAILAAYRRYAPQLFPQTSQSIETAQRDLAFTRLAPEPWRDMQSISIDYAIMERADNLVAMPLHTGWSDLGDWKSIWSASPHDDQGNALSLGATALDCHDSLLQTEDASMQLVGIGLEDMIVVTTADAVLGAPMAESQRVGEAVRALKAKGLRQAEQSRRDERPWGWFETLALGERFQVKRI